MFNPFEEESQNHSPENPLPCSLAPDPHSASPISLLQLDCFQGQFLQLDPDRQEVTEQKLLQFAKEMKSYSQGLEQRNVQIACELEKERMKNKQLMGALSFMMRSEEERKRVWEEQLSKMSENSCKFEVQVNRREMIESEVKALRLENGYLKDLILIANDNYQKLEEKNNELLVKYSALEQKGQQREVEVMKQTEELKSMLAALVIERNGDDKDRETKEGKDGKGTNSCGGGGSSQNGKGRREQADEAYRSIFSKTLRPRKQNINKQ